MSFKKRITSNGIHHFVKDAEHDKDPKIREVFTPEGFTVLELTAMFAVSGNYQVRIMTLTGMREDRGVVPSDLLLSKMGPLAVMQHYLDSRRRYLSNASFSTSRHDNPQLSGNMYRDKQDGD